LKKDGLGENGLRWESKRKPMTKGQILRSGLEHHGHPEITKKKPVDWREYPSAETTQTGKTGESDNEKGKKSGWGGAESAGEEDKFW